MSSGVELEPSKERQKELEKFAVRVYQQISAGFPMTAICSQFENSGLPQTDIDWIIENGKERYFGYQRYRRDVNRGSAKSFMFGGIVMVGIAILVLASVGSPSAGRHVGMLNFAILGGIGAILYGVYCWLTAEPKDVRTDLH